MVESAPIRATAAPLRAVCTWLDGLGIPRGVTSRLARHAENLTERVYIDHGADVEGESVARLPPLWPPGVEIFSIRRAKTVDFSTPSADTGSVTTGQGMHANAKTQRESTGRPERGHAMPDVTICSQEPGRSAVSRSANQPLSAAIRQANGQARAESSGESPREIAVRALAHFLLTDDEGGSTGADHENRSRTA